MNAKDAIGDDSSYRKEIKSIRYDFPCLYSHSSFTLIIKSIKFIQLAGFVISPQEEKIVRILDFIGHQQTNTFERLFSSIHIVTQKQVISFVRGPKQFENGEQVTILPMSVSTYLYRCFQLKEHGLFYQNIFHHDAQAFDLVVSQSKGSLIIGRLCQLDDDIINIYVFSLVSFFHSINQFLNAVDQQNDRKITKNMFESKSHSYENRISISQIFGQLMLLNFIFVITQNSKQFWPI